VEYSTGKDLERKTCRGSPAVVGNAYLYAVAEMGRREFGGKQTIFPRT
jgi:hypothetical protein